MPTTCTYILHHEAPVYYSGDEINGTIEIHCTRSKEFRVIKLIFLGKGTVCWNEVCRVPNITHDDSTRVVPEEQFEGEEVYVEAVVTLTEHIKIPANSRVVYDFNFTVPDHMPASCRFGMGSVTYLLKIVMQPRDAQAFAVTTEKEITIRRKYNLEPWNPLCGRKSIIGSIQRCSVRFLVPCSTFVPAQTLEYHLEYEAVPITHRVFVHFCQEVVFQSQRPTKHIRRPVYVLASTLSREQLRCPQSITLTGTLTLPLAIPFTTDEQSAGTLIKISYFICAVLKANKRFKVLAQLKIPITIATTTPRPSEPLPLPSASPSSSQDARPYCYDNLGLEQENSSDKENLEPPRQRSASKAMRASTGILTPKAARNQQKFNKKY